MKTLLCYSGGKDSLAVLLLSRSRWQADDFHVAWVDTGNQFPELYEHMGAVKRLVRNFHVLKTNTAAWQFENGHPVDLVPTSRDAMGRYIYGGDNRMPYVSRWNCCQANLWTPMAQFMSLMKPEEVLRGDRGEERAEGLKEAEGMKFVFPIFNWSNEAVRAYIDKEAPKFGLWQERHKLHEGSSLDCMTCTAFNCEHKERMQYLKEHHPELYQANQVFFERYKEDVFHEIKEIL